MKQFYHVLLTMILVWACFASADQSKPDVTAKSDAEKVIESEIVIEGLRVPLTALSKSVANLQLPDERGRLVLSGTVTVVDIANTPNEMHEAVLDLGFERGNWPVAFEKQTVAKENVNLWQDFLGTVDFFHHFKFYNIRGEFDGTLKYNTNSGFKGTAQLKSGKMITVSGKLGLRWQGHMEQVGDTEETVWYITGFETQSFNFMEGGEPLFADVGDIAFAKEPWSAVIASPRDDDTVDIVLDIRSGELEMQDYLDSLTKSTLDGTVGARDTTQTVVVDINRDGFDDFYVSGAYGPSVFFKNNGDGTFDDITSALGLDFENVLSAVFADLDNDGDADLFLSHYDRTHATRYLVNEAGRFVDRTDTLPDMPNWVLSITATDVNSDGLLDVYLATDINSFIASAMIANEHKKIETGHYPDKFPFMDDAVAHDVFERNRKDGNPVSKTYSPANWLMLNQGNGKFARATSVGDVGGQYNTLAASWTDMDLDGDMDLYLVSESGPNELIRNNGDGTFTDVSNAVTGEIGFGMGIGIGDYDNDGRNDMYITNMYSKAGLRIADQLGSSEIIVQSARGNTLLRNTEAGFVKTSSADDSGIQVEAADFGWGGGFADLNNDGFLDLYVPAGQQSMPQEVATIGDS
jgi:hypothetical protein